MFGDFLMLAAGQVINHIGKYRWMYNDKVRVPSARVFELLQAPPLRVAAKDLPIANTSTLETAILPQLEDIDRAVLRVCANSRRAITR
jgi:pyruvate/2-oxoglutarate/acetoin dehydrogenase E1 component